MSIIDNYSASFTNVSEYCVLLTFAAVHPYLSSQTGLLHGIKLDGSYEFQEFKSSTQNKYRYKSGGAWGEWLSV